ncbi:MAG TPA: hypothetical protein VHC22_27265 [Pirellulales bacterium]|nr:hypothetical protein [Pirellulales bacterium]
MSEFLTLEETNLSRAWARIFVRSQPTGYELSPFLLRLTDHGAEGPREIPELRDALDACLEASDMDGVQTVANTIFPQSLWRQAKGDRHQLYAAYLENLPDYVAMAPSKNRDGLYFARLIGFGIAPANGTEEPHLPAKLLQAGGNQLEFMIQHCRPGVRRTMFQAAVYDPVRDQSASAQQGFPCLQHLTFVPEFRNKTLSLNAFYATQQLFMKAYGNWLGLVRLGLFVAGQVDLRLGAMNCYVGIEKMDKRPKPGTALQRLRSAAAAAVVADAQPTST